MSGSGIIDVGTGVANAIGRYFSVISIVPSSLYVIFVYILIETGSWRHAPDWSRAFMSLERLGAGGFALLAFFSIALGVIIHPAQFAIVQFLRDTGGTRVSRKLPVLGGFCTTSVYAQASAARESAQ